MKVKRQELWNLIKYALRLGLLSNKPYLADVWLLANMVEEQTSIAISNVLCEMHDLRVGVLCQKDS